MKHLVVCALCAELDEIHKFGNVWVFVQLIFVLCWPEDELNKNLNIAELGDFVQLWSRIRPRPRPRSDLGLHFTRGDFLKGIIRP